MFEAHEWYGHSEESEEIEKNEGGDNRARVEWLNATDASYRWAWRSMNEIPSRGDADVDTRSWTLSQEKAFLLSGNPDTPPTGRARTLLRDVLEERRRGEGAGGGDSGRGTSCLTETWVSGGRFAWVDLQAGPFEWGPAAGGEGYKSSFSEFGPRRPPASPPGGWNNLTPKRRDDGHAIVLKALRQKLAVRVRRLAALQKQMDCGGEGKLNRGNNLDGGNRRIGAAAVACEEVVAQLAFLRRFQAREAEVLTAVDAAESARAAKGAVEDPSGDGSNQAFGEALNTLHRSHVDVLKMVVRELSPATESDSLRSATEETSAELDVESQALLARIAALVSSFARGVITPPSTLPMPRHPPDARQNFTRTTNAHDGQGTAGATTFDVVDSDSHRWSLQSDEGDVNRPSSKSPPQRLPTGTSLTRARGSSFAPAGGGAAAAARAFGCGSSLVGTRGGDTNGAHPLLPPLPPSPLELFVPEALAFTLYVVRAQDAYPPLGATPLLVPGTGGTGPEEEMERAEEVNASLGEEGDRAGTGRKEGGAGGTFYDGGSSGFDLHAFQEGAMLLRLPEQQASFTVHQVDASSDPVLAGALAWATMEAAVNVVTAEG